MPELTHIPELIEEHFEELSFLLHLRALHQSSGQMLYRQFIDLDDRIQGHIDGLLAVPDAARDFAIPHLAGDDDLHRRAAAYILLSLGHAPSITKSLDLLANPKAAPSILDAMLLRKSNDTRDALKKLSTTIESPLLAATAVTIMCEHFPRDINPTEFTKLLTHAEAPVRTADWRAAQRHPEPRPQPQYRAACADPTPAVRNEALLAAVWTNQPFILDICRPLLKKITPENLIPMRLFAILAPPTEAAAIADLAKPADLGPQRFDLLASSHLPAMVPHLLAAMRNPDAPSSAAAAEAFARLTNFQPPTKSTTKAAPAGGEKPSDFEKEFQPEINIPDPDAAQKYWSTIEPQLAPAPRISRGHIIDPLPPPATLLELDNAARDTLLLRNLSTPEGKKFTTLGSRWSFPQRATT